MRRRLIAVMVAMAVVLTGLGVRLYSLSGGKLQAASEQQATRRETIAVARGTIYDRYLQPLVNRSKRILASVAPFSECVALMEQTLSGTYRQTVVSALSQGERTLVEMNGWVSPTVGVVQISAPIRYDSDALACHVVGYINGEGDGVSGMEKVYNELLASYRGEASVSYSIDALGGVAIGGEDVLTNTLDNALGGVALTLDSEIQRIVQQAAVAYLERGAVVVTDAVSGDVLASVSVPVYDQNDVESALEDPSSPLPDRTRMDYDLGSVFKLITAAAALERGFSTGKTYTCTGYVEVDGIRFHCHNPLGDGKQTMGQAMANSCNCYFIQLALDVGATAIYDLAQRAGFSEAITLTADYQTARAVLPSRQDISADAALANLSIGQGDLLATPYHVAALFGAVAAEGILTRPTLFYGTVDEKGVLTEDPTLPETVRLFSSATAAQLRAMLRKVVEEGTGMAAAPREQTAAGKTGTAQTGWEINGEEVVQSWFAGMYSRYVITVLSENGGTNGKTAAPLFATIADALFEAGLVDLT